MNAQLMFPKPQKKSKNRKRSPKPAFRKPSHAGRTFDSGLERDLYDDLLLRPDLTEVECQVTIYMTEARISFRVDYSAWSSVRGRREYFEAKGIEDREWQIKKRLWRFYGPGPLYIYVREGKRGVRLSQVVSVRALG